MSRRRLRKALTTVLGELNGSYRDTVSFLEAQGALGQRRNPEICPFANFISERLEHLGDVKVEVYLDRVTLTVGTTTVARPLDPTTGRVIKHFDDRVLEQFDAHPNLYYDDELTPADRHFLSGNAIVIPPPTAPVPASSLPAAA